MPCVFGRSAAGSAIRYIDGICRAPRDAVRISMTIVTGSIVVGRCYLTPSSEVRRVLEVDSKTVTYVVRGKMAFPSWDKKRGNPQARKTSRVRSAVKCRAIGTRTKRNGSLIEPPPAPVFVFVSLLHLTEILLSPPFQGIRITVFSRSGSAMGTANSCASLGTFSGRAHMTAGASPRIACSLHAACLRGPATAIAVTLRSASHLDFRLEPIGLWQACTPSKKTPQRMFSSGGQFVAR